MMMTSRKHKNDVQPLFGAVCVITCGAKLTVLFLGEQGESW